MFLGHHRGRSWGKRRERKNLGHVEEAAGDEQAHVPFVAVVVGHAPA
jgi:hypothetical protein